jgi:xanthine dehydrogenase accessory factor
MATVVRTAGSTPRKATARMLVLGDGTIRGTIGGGRVEKEVTDAAQALLAEGATARARLVRFHLTRELAMCCGGEMEVFLEPLLPDPALVVCGAGHVAQALVPLARSVGFAPIVVDELPEMANAERFPGAERFVDSFDVRDWKDVPLDGDCYVVIVTRDHAQDQALLEQLVGRELAYLGLIGSRRKIEMFKQRLEARGVAAERFARLNAPIGLDIGAETPEEIAVAIVAQLIQTRAGRRAAAATSAAEKKRAGAATASPATMARGRRPSERSDGRDPRDERERSDERDNGGERDNGEVRDSSDRRDSGDRRQRSDGRDPREGERSDERDNGSERDNGYVRDSSDRRGRERSDGREHSDERERSNGRERSDERERSDGREQDAGRGLDHARGMGPANAGREVGEAHK